MGKADQDFKQFLVHHAHEVVAAELGVTPDAFTTAENEPQPLPRERRLDRVFIFTIGLLHLYIHFEVQNSRDPNMAHRMHEYGVRLMYSRRDPNEWWPVLSIILWPRKVNNIPETPLRIPVGFGQEIVWPIIHIKVFEWKLPKLETDAPGILILAPLVPDVKPKDLETYARRLYNVTTGTERENAGVLFFTFVEDRYRHLKNWPTMRTQVLQMLKKVGYGMDVIDEMILNTLTAQEAIEVAKKQAEQEGEARGEARGKVQGEALGKTLGEMLALRTLWAKKFGTVTEDVEAALQEAASAKLEETIAQMLDPVYTLAQARQDLGLAD